MTKMKVTLRRHTEPDPKHLRTTGIIVTTPEKIIWLFVTDPALVAKEIHALSRKFNSHSWLETHVSMRVDLHDDTSFSVFVREAAQVVRPLCAVNA